MYCRSSVAQKVSSTIIVLSWDGALGSVVWCDDVGWCISIWDSVGFVSQAGITYMLGLPG